MSRKINYDEVTKALRTLVINGNNVQRTSQELGISRSTLTFWREKHGHLVMDDDDEGEGWDVKENDTSTIAESVAKKQLIVKEKMLDKLYYLVKSCQNANTLDSLAKAFKNISEIGGVKSPVPDDAPLTGMIAHANIFHTVTNILKLKYESNGSIDNTPVGDSKESPGQ